MPSANPFAPVIDVGGSATVGPAAASGNLSLGAASDNHGAAAWILLGLVVLVVLHKYAKFRFSTTVG